MKMLSKDQGSGITKLPNQMQSGFQESIVTETLVKNGYDPRLIKDEAELKMIMNRIRASKQQTKEQKQKAMKQLADIMDMKGRKIPQGSKIMGGEAVETEAEIAERLVRENKEAAQRLRDKKLVEDFDPDEGFAEGGEVSGTFGVLSYNADVSRMIDQKVTEYENEYMKRTGELPPEFYGDKYRMQLQKEYLMENKAYGGRVGLMAGGMGRRAFLKMMAGAGGMAAAAKAGLLSAFRNVSQVKENVVETISKTDAQGIPEHFMALVNKILKEGKITGEADRIRTYKHPTRKDIEMDLDVGSGDIDVRFETDRGSKGNYFLKKGQADEATGGRTPPDEFMEGEEVYKFGKDGESYVKDFEEGIQSGTSNLDEFVGIKKQDFASGGIAGMLGE